MKSFQCEMAQWVKAPDGLSLMLMTYMVERENWLQIVLELPDNK